MTAAFATLPEMSRGRLFPEEGSATGPAFSATATGSSIRAPFAG